MERFSVTHFFSGVKVIEPAKSVPKKYWKYASKFPTRQLYKVYWAAYGLIFTCIECGREIPSLEKFRRLCFREPKSMFARKVCIPLCKDCDAGLKHEKAKAVETEVSSGRQSPLPNN